MTSILQNNYVQVYLNDCKLLIKTLIVKSSYAAYAINQELKSIFGDSIVDEYNKDTWKYYMNVAGEYHSTDKPMYVISLDTKERILFSPENLEVHKVTAENYKHGSRYYLALVNQYPEQEFLINCILTPANKTYAVEAPDGAILGYQKDLVEEAEGSLMVELENFIMNFNSRWNVEAFSLTDPYYPYIQRFILGQQLLLKLVNLRTKRCKTDEAHSFHVMQYLASHCRIDRWATYLTRKQLMWFYRNIAYIQRNPGKVETFRELVKIIFEEADVPLSEITINQLANFDADGYPLIRAKRKDLIQENALVTSMDFNAFRTRELNTVYGNKSWSEIHGEKEVKKLKVSKFSQLRTKSLETSKTSERVNLPDRLEDSAVRNWISLTFLDNYDAPITFQDPKTAQEFTLTSWDAVIYIHYLALKAEKATFRVLPPIRVPHFRLNTLPSLKSLLDRLPPTEKRIRTTLTDFYNLLPAIEPVSTVSEMNALLRKISYQTQKQWMILADEDDMYARGYLEASFLKFFGSALFDFARGEDIEVWRARLNLPNFDMSWKETADLINAIVYAATGIDISVETKNANKDSLIKLFSELSSYSIQFVSDVSDNDYIITNTNSLRTSLIGSGNYSENQSDPSAPPKISALFTEIETELFNIRRTGPTGGPSMTYLFADMGGVSVIDSPLEINHGALPGDLYIFAEQSISVIGMQSGSENIFIPSQTEPQINIID